MHLFDRFYVVTKFMFSSLGDLKFSNLNYDITCAYLDNKMFKIQKQEIYVRSKDFLQKDRTICNLF